MKHLKCALSTRWSYDRKRWLWVGIRGDVYTDMSQGMTHGDDTLCTPGIEAIRWTHPACTSFRTPGSQLVKVEALLSHPMLMTSLMLSDLGILEIFQESWCLGFLRGDRGSSQRQSFHLCSWVHHGVTIVIDVTGNTLPALSLPLFLLYSYI